MAIGSTPVAAQFDATRDHIRRILVDEGIPSIAVAVARDGEVIWEEAFGWADRERRTPADEHTMYSLASISKPITATGLMILVERGVVELDEPVNTYLGDARLRGRAGDASEATVRRVANHTAGLPLHYQFFYEDEPYTRPPMDETIRRYGNLLSAPGERYQYSNLGFGVLDYVIARQSGQTYEDFMRTEVFIPLGLTRTSVHIGPGLEPFTATRYAGDGTPIPFYGFDHPGGSAVFSSAHDLIRFGMFHLGNDLADQRKILSAESIEAMATPTTDTGPAGGYGIGWATARRSDGVNLVRHSGGMGGVSTQLVLAPEHDVAVAVLSNASSRWPSVLADEILTALIPEPEAPAASGNGDADPRPFEPDTDLQGEWHGSVATHEGSQTFSLDIRADGTVFVRLAGQPLTLLSGPRMRNGFLTGFFSGDIGTADANRRPYRLVLDVKLRGAVLGGALIAQSLPAVRVGNALSHWVELEKR